ncbi:Zinc finger, SWIM-type [Sesbania bispinosa]|nr:Zinc finger, SWIM-type [Sesbania bispinosa]
MWATTHLRGKFFGGFRTTSRCEGLHSELGKFVNASLDAVRCTIYRVCGQRDGAVECRVSFYPSNNEFKCGCLKMEPRGLPCEHIVALLVHLGYDELPESLVIKRWSKGAKDGLGAGSSSNNDGMHGLRNPSRAGTKGRGGISSNTGLRVRRKQQCSVCKLPGHNKVTCPNRAGPSQVREVDYGGPSYVHEDADVYFGSGDEDEDNWTFA